MKQPPQIVLRLAIAALLAPPFLLGTVQAPETRSFQHVIKVQAQGAEVIEADVSDLQPGEAMSFTTESGQLVDILQGIDGIEIYLDGELVADPAEWEIETAHDVSIHERAADCAEHAADACEVQHKTVVQREFEFICAADNEADCEDINWSGIADAEMIEELHSNGRAEVIVIRKTHEETHENPAD